MFGKFKEFKKNLDRERRAAICQEYAEIVAEVRGYDVNNMPPLAQLALFISINLDPAMKLDTTKLIHNFYTRTDLLVLSSIYFEFFLSLAIDDKRLTEDQAYELYEEFIWENLPLAAQVVLKLDLKDFRKCLERADIRSIRKMAYKAEIQDVFKAAIPIILSDKKANTFTDFDGKLEIHSIVELTETTNSVLSFFSTRTKYFGQHINAAIEEVRNESRRAEAEKILKEVAAKDFGYLDLEEFDDDSDELQTSKDENANMQNVMKDASYATIRPQLEHQDLPEIFYEDPIRFVSIMAENGDKQLFDVYDDAMPNRYEAKDFRVDVAPNKRGGLSLIFVLPKPDCILSCSLIGIITDKKGEYANYYTVEQSVGGAFFLCAKSADGTHANIKKCSKSLEDQIMEIIRCIEIGVPE